MNSFAYSSMSQFVHGQKENQESTRQKGHFPPEKGDGGATHGQFRPGGGSESKRAAYVKERLL